MGLFDLLAIIIGIFGSVAVICSIGWWSTVKPRLEHQQKMFALNEQAKLNAVTIQERQQTMLMPRSEYATSPQFYVAENGPERLL